MDRYVWSRALFFLGALLIPSSLLGQTIAGSQFKESVEVRAAEIQVLAVDSTGRPILDLRPEEFVLTVDGVVRKIDWILPPSSTERPKLPVGRPAVGAPAVVAEPGKPSLDSSAGLHSTVLFVDEAHVDFRSRSLAIRALRLYVKTLPPEEEVAVFSFRSRLQLVQQFTTDRNRVAAALERLGRTVPASKWVQELKSREAWIGESRAALRDLSLMLQGIAGRPEPKTVVVVAGYVPTSSWELPDPSHTTPFSFREEVQKGMDEAFLAKATVVALDPSGVPPFGTEAEHQTSQWAAKQASESAAGGASPVADDSRSDIVSGPAPIQPESLSAGGDAFATLARETGGARLYQSNRLEEALAAQTDLLRSRYRIGFTPDAQSSQTRKVVVTVTRPGIGVRTASGQRSLWGESLVRANFGSSLLKADAPSSDFPIRVTRAKKSSGGRGSLSLELDIPLREIFLQETAGAFDGRVEILAAAMENDGAMSEIQSERVEVHVPRKDVSRLDRSYFKKLVSLQVRGKGSILIGVRDTTTNRVGLARFPYDQ